MCKEITKEETTKKDLLIWSGGMDSTSILLDYVRQRKPIETIYIQLENNAHKAKIEQHRRGIIKGIIRDTYEGYIPDRNVVIGAREGGGAVTLWQPSLWLQGIISIMPAEQYNTILFGYIRGDDFWHIQDNFKKAFYNLWKIMCVSSEVEPPELKFPLEWQTKEDVADSYLKDSLGREVIDYIWTCETPTQDFKECGICLPCRHIKPVRERYNAMKADRFKLEPIEEVKQEETEQKEIPLDKPNKM